MTAIVELEKGSVMELAIFKVGDIVCALKSIEVQEIIKQQNTTPVSGAPDYVNGVINLRGQIVTVISLRQKFNIPETGAGEKSQIVVVKMGEESIGLRVDSVDDILITNSDEISPTPSNLKGLKGAYVSGIYKKKDALVAILNIDQILAL